MNIKQKFSLLFVSLTAMTALGSCVSDNMPDNGPIDDPTLYLTKEVKLEPKSLSDTIYFSFKQNKAMALSADSAKMNPDWDIAFTQGNGFCNEIGTQKVRVITLNREDFDQLTSYVADYAEDSMAWTMNKKASFVPDFTKSEPVYYKGDFNRKLCFWFNPTEYGKAYPNMKIDRKIRLIKTLEGRYVKLQFDQIYQDPENHTGYGSVQLRYAYVKSIPSPIQQKDDSTYVLNDKKRMALSTIYAGKNLDKVYKLQVNTTLSQDDVNFLKANFGGLISLDLTNATLDINPFEKFLQSNYKTPIKKVIMPKNLKILGKGWLNKCKYLEEVVVPGDSLEQVMDGAFSGSANLKKVTLPNSVTSILHDAFSFSGIESFTIPNQVIDIEHSTFFSCKNLKEVVVPASVKLIAGRAFCQCPNLEKIIFKGTTPPSINDVYYYGMIKEPLHEYTFNSVPWDKNGKPFVKFIVPKGKINEYMKALELDAEADRPYIHEAEK